MPRLSAFQSLLCVISLQILASVGAWGLFMGPHSEKMLSLWILITCLSMTASIVTHWATVASSVGLVIAAFSKKIGEIFIGFLLSNHANRVLKSAVVPLCLVNLAYQLGLFLFSNEASFQCLIGFVTLGFAALNSFI